MSFTVEVKGINDVVKRLKRLGDEVAEDADKAMGYSAKKIEEVAKKNAPSDKGQLKSSGRVIDKYLDKEVYFGAPHAPYIEFGTKKKVEVPADLKQYAMQFKGKRSTNMTTEQIKENIYRWARLKGIPKDMWGYIYFTIMKNGINPQPFLYPASRKELPKLKRKLNIIVDKKR